MRWTEVIENEYHRILPGENPGRTRTIARRMSGIALQHLYSDTERSFIQLLQRASADIHLPSNVRFAAERLSARISDTFLSQSINPVADARLIVDHVKNHFGL